MIVCKFGGTSVGDAAAIGRLIGIVAERRTEQPLVVVSALARVTDGLLALGGAAAAGDHAAIDAGVDGLVGRHAEVAAALPGAAGALGGIRDEAERLRSLLHGAAGRGLTPAELDRLAGTGELWSSMLVTAALAGAGLPAAWVDVRPVLRTDRRFTRATPLPGLADRARAAFGWRLAGGEVPVTQGFIGSTEDGEPTTLGRGGSDFTASLLGAALDAVRVEIWTDVDGLMSADPRIVPEAHTLPVATYEEAAELATFGAKVLHPATQLPLAERKIPFAILNSRRPEHPGTLIVERIEHEASAPPIRSISLKRGIVVINIRAPRMLGAFGFLREVFEIFERHEVVVDVLASSEVSISITMEEPGKLPVLVRELEGLGEVAVSEGRAVVAVVGVGIRSRPGIAARVFQAVQPANVEVISQGASAINMTFIVREADAAETVRRLHLEFFGA